jgi:membrane carboxypeptidase/penicillin-binding protein
MEKREKYPSAPISSPPEGALICFDLETGFVKAMVGGRDFEKSQFNRVTQARRQTGSAFKPIVYASALDKGFTPASIIIDSPIIFDWGDNKWNPQNFEGKFSGPTTLRNALTHSINVSPSRSHRSLALIILRIMLKKWEFHPLFIMAFQWLLVLPVFLFTN